MGIDFIAYEETGVDGNGDQRAYVYTDDAIKLGVYTPLTTEIEPDTTRVGNPDILSCWEALGAVRMYETKVVEIACTPLP